MSAIQPDLFGGSAVIGGSRSVKRDEAAQCVGQTDVFSLTSTRYTLTEWRALSVEERPRCEECGGRTYEWPSGDGRGYVRCVSTACLHLHYALT